MECRVLSIQSHVVRGYVGNKSASFPLQVNTNRMHPLSDTLQPLRTRPRRSRCSRESDTKPTHVNAIIVKQYANNMIGYYKR
ncbi:Pyridoxal kinase, partial [Dissostichus eleginoides]